MYNIMYETSCQSRFDTRYWMLGASALGRPRGIVWGGRRVQDGENMYTCGGFDVWQNQYNIVKLKNKKNKKEISPDCSLEGLILKLKLQYFGHLMQRSDSLEKTLMLERLKAGGEGDDRG